MNRDEKCNVFVNETEVGGKCHQGMENKEKGKGGYLFVCRPCSSLFEVVLF